MIRSELITPSDTPVKEAVAVQVVHAVHIQLTGYQLMQELFMIGAIEISPRPCLSGHRNSLSSLSISNLEISSCHHFIYNHLFQCMREWAVPNIM